MSEVAEAKHRVTTTKQVTRTEFFGLFDASVWAQIEDRLKREDVAGVVCFENRDMCSSRLGHRSALIYGPGCENKDLDQILGRHLGDVPSRFQYPTRYYVKETKE